MRQRPSSTGDAPDGFAEQPSAAAAVRSASASSSGAASAQSPEYRACTCDLEEFEQLVEMYTPSFSQKRALLRRMKVMEEMRNFQLRVLVSTDLTARGVDLTHVNLVINLDVPPSGATYMHRIGRTGRFGTSGVAIAVLTASELERLRADLSEERGGVIVPLPDVIPSSWYEYELDAEDAELFQTLKDAPIEVSSDESESEDAMDDAEALSRGQNPSPSSSAGGDERARDVFPETIYLRDLPMEHAESSHRESVDYDEFWRYFHLRHPAVARPPRFLSLPPGETEHPWIVPPLHADLARLPFVRHRP